MTILLAVTVGFLYAVGTYLLTQRSLSRIVIGLAVLGHGANLLLLAAGGRAGHPPVAGGDAAVTADPLPQALALTAVVITFGVSGFLLAMAYRSWRQSQSDLVEDDLEDRRIAVTMQRLEASRRRTEEAAAADGEPLEDSGPSEGGRA